MNTKSRLAAPAQAKVRVWDAPVRISHWLVALGCFLNLSLLKHADEPHEWVGYAVVAAVLLRILWGVVAPGHAHFRSFIPSLGTLLTYFRLLVRNREPRYLGHNPAGAAMMMTLIVLVLACGITGWLMGLDAFWGDNLIRGIHEASANAILILATVHVAGAVFSSVRHRENLILSMVTGFKRAPAVTDIDQANSRTTAQSGKENGYSSPPSRD